MSRTAKSSESAVNGAPPAATAAPAISRAGAKQRSRGPAPLVGSEPARRQAAAILEVLAGVRRPSEAAQALSTSLPRYYQLERRALVGLLKACEPAPRGPRVDLSRQLAALERENRRLKRECDRQQALVRMAERGLGLPPPASVVKGNAMKGTTTKSASTAASGESKGAAKKRRARRASVRALTMIRSLAAEIGESSPSPSSEVAVATIATAPCETCV